MLRGACHWRSGRGDTDVVFIFVRLHTLRNIKPKIIVQIQNFFHGGNWISEVLYLFAHRHSKKSRGAFQK